MPHLPDDRPTSPHLSVYRPQITSVLSITHRMTGLALYAGSGLLVAWLWAAAYSAKTYQGIYGFMHAWYGQFLLFCWTIAFFYHLSNGIRHLVWDAGYGFSIKAATRTGWAVLLLTIALTAITWWCAYRPVM